jgi:hypothetical protein
MGYRLFKPSQFAFNWKISESKRTEFGPLDKLQLVHELKLPAPQVTLVFHFLQCGVRGTREKNDK